MEIVIKIPEETYQKIKENMAIIGRRSGRTFDSILFNAVANGTPLPKHEDLIDKGKFKRWIETQDGDKLMTEYYLEALDAQETIVGGSHDGDID